MHGLFFYRITSFLLVTNSWKATRLSFKMCLVITLESTSALLTMMWAAQLAQKSTLKFSVSFFSYHQKKWQQQKVFSSSKNTHVYLTDPPEIEVDQTWIPTGEGIEAEVSCNIHAEPVASVSSIFLLRQHFVLKSSKKYFLTSQQEVAIYSFTNIFHGFRNENQELDQITLVQGGRIGESKRIYG